MKHDFEVISSEAILWTKALIYIGGRVISSEYVPKWKVLEKAGRSTGSCQSLSPLSARYCHEGQALSPQGLQSAPRPLADRGLRPAQFGLIQRMARQSSK